MDKFLVNQIAPRVFSILDAGMSSFYVVEGDALAAVIDTGITPGEQITPVVRQVTQKPLVLVVTHAHIDHLHHMDEFDTVYLCHEELKLPQQFLQNMSGGKSFDLAATRDIRTGSRIDLGGDTLEICQVAGHSPGSVVVHAQKPDMLFTGDAIGSGYGVWMQVPGAAPLDVYYESLVQLMAWLVARGGRMKFCGGHHYQQFESSLVPGYNPLNMGLLADLIDLVDKLLKGEIVGRESNVDKVFSLEPTLYASYGRAEIQYSPAGLAACRARMAEKG